MGARTLILTFGLTVLFGTASDVLAQRGMAMREKVYSELSKAQVATEEGNWAKALDALKDVEKMRDLDANEKAQLYTAYGYFYFSQEKYPESIDAYEKVLQQEELPEAVVTSTLYTLAQLWFHVGNYENAASRLQRWLQSAPDPGPEPYVLLGQAYYQLERPRDALPPMERALAIAATRGVTPRENWYVLLRALYHETDNFPKLLETLDVLVTRFPRKDYWLHLAATHGEMGNDRKQLAAYEAAYAQGMLSSGRELLLLSQLLLQGNVPYRAGQILSRALADGVIEGTTENWRLLSQAWILAREDQQAVDALRKASNSTSDGELDARLAQVYVNLDDWENAAEAARTALRKGVRDPHDLQIMLGMALYEQSRFDEAKAAFREAQRNPEGRETASQWLLYIEREEERLLDLQRSLQ